MAPTVMRIDLMTKYLEPLPENKQEKKEMMDSLRELRNKVTMCSAGESNQQDDEYKNTKSVSPSITFQISFIYFIVNAFWLIVTFTLQLLDSSVFIKVPKINNNLEYTGEYIFIDPVGFMFILSFVLLVIIQFFGMLFHRRARTPVKNIFQLRTVFDVHGGERQL